MPERNEPVRCACPECGYDLRGITPREYRISCPECGGEWLPTQLSPFGRTLARSARAVYVRWGLWGGVGVGIATIGAIATGLFTIAISAMRWKSVFVGVGVGAALCFLCIPAFWGVALWATDRAFKRVFVAHGCHDAEPLAAQATGRVFLMHIAMTVLLILVALLVL